MGYRYTQQNEKAGDFTFRMMEVVMVQKKRNGRDTSRTQVLIVDNHWDTLRYVQDNMNDFIGNVIKMKRMIVHSRKKVEESAQLFERNLQPLFSMISETSKNNILDKLSSSLKKALILMAMDRYKCDKESICRALGLSPDSLDKEMNLCGLDLNRKAA